MSYLLDTNIVSELVKPAADPWVMRWVDQFEDQLFLSVATFAEMQRGIDLMTSGRRREGLRRWLSDDLPDRFAGRIFDIDRRIAEAWGAVMVRGQRVGETVSVMDGFFAATAEAHGLTLATRNVRHFARLEIAVFNPWDHRP